MARCLLILLLPAILSLSLLADARYELVQPGQQEVDNPLVLHDAFEHENPLRLPSEKKNEMMKDVPLLVHRPLDRYEVSSANPGEYHPRAETQESRIETRERAFEHSGKRFPAREQNHPHGYGQDPWEWRSRRAEEHRRGRYERPEYPHGGKMKFEHLWGDGPREGHLHFRPQFSRPSFFPSSEEESVSSFGSFPGEFRPRPENEESGFESRERAFRPFRKGFPEREHHYPHRHGQGGWEWEFPRGEDHNHGRYERHEYAHGGEMEFRHFWEDGPRGDHFHFRPQFPRPSPFPGSGEHGKEAISSSFRSFPGEFRPRAENERPGFDPRERAFERVGKGFPEREHNHPHGHGQGQWEWEFPNREEHKYGRHQRHEYPHGSEMKFRRFWGDGPRGDHFRFRPQFPRPSSFPSSESHSSSASLRKSIPEEVRPRASLSSSFGSFPEEVRPRADNEKFGFQPRERAFERIVGRPDFPDHGQRLFLNSDEHKHEWHERHEDPPAPWTDWLKSLFQGH